MRWFEVVRVKSTSSWFITSSKLTPSVSSCHSEVLPNASVLGSTPITLASRMNTFLMSLMPRSARLSNICASRRSMRNSHGDMRLGSTSSSGIS